MYSLTIILHKLIQSDIYDGRSKFFSFQSCFADFMNAEDSFRNLERTADFNMKLRAQFIE